MEWNNPAINTLQPALLSSQPVMNRLRGLDRGLQESTAKESGRAEGLFTSKGRGRCRPILWLAVTGGRLSRNSVIFRPPR
jgi:hypothetical protein